MNIKLSLVLCLITVTVIKCDNAPVIRKTTIPANLTSEYHETFPGYEAATFQVFDVVGSRYKYFVGWFAVDWFTATRICHKNDWEFVSIADEKQNDEIIDVIKNMSDLYEYWISGTDLGNTGEFWWTSIGKPIDYFHWDRGEPKLNEAIGNCIKLFNRKAGRGVRWNVDDCNLKKTFICMQLKNYL